MAGVLPGKVIGVTIDGDFIDCQIDATLTKTNNVTETTGCKPSPDGTYKGASTVGRTVDTSDWTITMSAKAFADAVTVNQNDIAEKMDTNPIVQVTFQTTQTTDFDFEEAWVYEGEGILTDFTINAPQDGEATWDTTIVANGTPLTLTRTPIVVT